MAVLRSDVFARPGRRERRRGPGAATIGFLFVSIALIVFSRLDHSWVARFHECVSPSVIDVVAASSEPLRPVRAVTTWFADMLTLHGELERLRVENATLKQQQWQSHALQRRVTELSAAANVVATNDKPALTTRVAAYTAGPFVRSIVIEGGEAAGFQPGYPVLDPSAAVVGRIVEVYERYARVLLLDDATSRVAVVVGDNRHRAIAVGNGRSQLRLLYVPAGVAVSAGDAISTSGHDGMFPEGLRIGSIAEVHGNVFKAEMAAAPERLSFVTVVLYRGPAQALARHLADGQAPPEARNVSSAAAPR